MNPDRDPQGELYELYRERDRLREELSAARADLATAQAHLVQLHEDVTRLHADLATLDAQRKSAVRAGLEMMHKGKAQMKQILAERDLVYDLLRSLVASWSAYTRGGMHDLERREIHAVMARAHELIRMIDAITGL